MGGSFLRLAGLAECGRLWFAFAGLAGAVRDVFLLAHGIVSARL
jgi:hypothetical protein